MWLCVSGFVNFAACFWGSSIVAQHTCSEETFFAFVRNRYSMLMDMISTEMGLKVMVKIIASVYWAITVMPGTISLIFFCDLPSHSMRDRPLWVFISQMGKLKDGEIKKLTQGYRAGIKLGRSLRVPLTVYITVGLLIFRMGLES